MAAKEDYILGRDVLASARLNLQHYFWISSTGFLLHPAIALPEHALVADIGCGTGIWTVEMSSKLPLGGRIEASDISLAQTPPKAWWPGNVAFNEFDIFSTIPDTMLGRYDVVQIRLFMCVVHNNDPMPLLHNLLKLLKPGGYLQWQEYDPSADHIVTSTSDTVAPKLKALRAMIGGADEHDDRIRSNWVSTLHTRIESAGAELVEHVKVPISPSYMSIRQDTTFLALREFAAGMQDQKPEVAAKLRQLGEEAEQECWATQRGSAVQSELVTWVVRKI